MKFQKQDVSLIQLFTSLLCLVAPKRAVVLIVFRIKLCTEVKSVLSLSIVTTFISKWVPMNFDGTEKMLLEGSHDLWERNRKIVYHKI